MATVLGVSEGESERVEVVPDTVVKVAPVQDTVAPPPSESSIVSESRSARSERVKVACRLRPPSRIGPLAWTVADNTVVAARNPHALTPCPSPQPTRRSSTSSSSSSHSLHSSHASHSLHSSHGPHGSHSSSSRVPPSAAMSAQRLQPTGPLPAKALTFEFNHVFAYDSSNFEVYNEFCKGAVERAVAGCRAVVLVYGQTGTGKTHTISGSTLEAGVFHHAMADIFRAARDNMSRHDASCQHDDVSASRCDDGSKSQHETCHVGASQCSTSAVRCQPAADTSAAVENATSSSSSSSGGSPAATRSPPLMCFLSVVEIYNERAMDLLQGVKPSSGQTKANGNSCSSSSKSSTGGGSTTSSNSCSTIDSSSSSSGGGCGSSAAGSSSMGVGTSGSSAILYTAERKPITEHQLNSLEEAAVAFELAGQRRKVRGTSRNKQSSRSHTLYVIRIRRRLPGGPAVGELKGRVRDSGEKEQVSREMNGSDKAKEPRGETCHVAAGGDGWADVGSGVGGGDDAGGGKEHELPLLCHGSPTGACAEAQHGDGQSTQGPRCYTEELYIEGHYSEGLLYLVDLAGSESCKGEEGPVARAAAAAGGGGREQQLDGPWWGGESPLVPLITGLPKGPLLPPLAHRQKQYLKKQGRTHTRQQQQQQQVGGQRRVGQREARRRETESINKSLLALTSVLTHLSQARPGLPPYRRSLLTRLLQPCLGGRSGGNNGNGGGSSGYCAVLFCIDPQDIHVSKTTLRYSAMTRRIRMDYRPSILSLSAPKHAPPTVHKPAARRLAQGAPHSRGLSLGRQAPSTSAKGAKFVAVLQEKGRKRGASQGSEGENEQKGALGDATRASGEVRASKSEKGADGNETRSGVEGGMEAQEKIKVEDEAGVVVEEKGEGVEEKGREVRKDGEKAEERSQVVQQELKGVPPPQQQQRHMQGQLQTSHQRGILVKTQQQHVQSPWRNMQRPRHVDRREQQVWALQQQVQQLLQHNQQLQRQRLQLLLLWRRGEVGRKGGLWMGDGEINEVRVEGVLEGMGGVSGIEKWGSATTAAAAVSRFDTWGSATTAGAAEAPLAAGVDISSDSGSSSDGASDVVNVSTENVTLWRGEGEERDKEGRVGEGGRRRRRKGWSCVGSQCFDPAAEPYRTLSSVSKAGKALLGQVTQARVLQDSVLQRNVLQDRGMKVQAAGMVCEQEESGEAVIEWYNGYGDYSDKENASSEYERSRLMCGDKKVGQWQDDAATDDSAANGSSTFDTAHSGDSDSGCASPGASSLSPDSGSGNVSPNSSCSDPLLPSAPLATPTPTSTSTSTSKFSFASASTSTCASSTSTTGSATTPASTFSIPISPRIMPSPPDLELPSRSPSTFPGMRKTRTIAGQGSFRGAWDRDCSNPPAFNADPQTLHACTPPVILPHVLSPYLPFMITKRRAASGSALPAAAPAAPPAAPAAATPAMGDCAVAELWCDSIDRDCGRVNPWKCAAFVCTAMQCVALDVQSRGDGEEGDEEDEKGALDEAEIRVKQAEGVKGWKAEMGMEENQAMEGGRRRAKVRPMPVVLQRWLAMACVCFSSHGDLITAC
ncbi:hypothetical protein CLOM_g18334 [Closterium sp. NIES-68]|nr:hypothetical protein CLOM_g18334 [Closterium sp. NIES-68]